MLLRTLTGPHAGTVEDYTYEAGRNALAAGFAERLDEPGRIKSAGASDAASKPRKPSVKRSARG